MSTENNKEKKTGFVIPIKYGRRRKVLSTKIPDKLEADFRIKLLSDKLDISKFVRNIIIGYVEDDPDIINFINKIKQKLGIQSDREQKMKILQDEEKNKTALDFGIDEKEIEYIFDLLEKDV